MVVGQIDGAQVLEVAEILLDDLHDVLGVQFGLDGLVRQLDPAGVEDQETVQKLATLSIEHL